MGINLSVITKRDMNETTLIGGHGRKLYRPTLAQSASGSRLRHRNNLILAATLISLDINYNRITKTELPTHKQREQGLKSLKRTTMATDQDSKVGSSNIKDQLALITVILIDGRVGGVEVSKNGAQNRNGDIGDSVELSIGKHLAGFIALRKHLKINQGLLGNDRLIVHQLRHGSS